MAALRVLGPSSVWFLTAVARMSRASSSGDRGCSVFAVLGVEASMLYQQVPAKLLKYLSSDFLQSNSSMSSFLECFEHFGVM